MNHFFNFINEEINYNSIKGGPRSSATKEYIIQALKNNKIYDKVDTALYLKFLDKDINTDWIDRFIKHAAEIILHGSSTTKYGDLIKGRERAYGGSAPVYKEMMLSLGFENTGNARNVSWYVKKSDKLVKFPAYYKSKNSGAIVKFTSLESGVVVDQGNGSKEIGYSSNTFKPCDDKQTWVLVPDYKESKEVSATIKASHTRELIKFAVNMTDVEHDGSYSHGKVNINGVEIGNFGSYGYGTVNPEAMSNILKAVIGEKNVGVLKTRIKNTSIYNILFGKSQAGNWATSNRIDKQQGVIISTLSELIVILNKEFGTNISTSVKEDSSDYTKLQDVKAVEIKPASNPKEKEIKETISKLKELKKLKFSYNSACVEVDDYIKRQRLNVSSDVDHIYYEMNRDSLIRSIEDAITFYENLIK